MPDSRNTNCDKLDHAYAMLRSTYSITIINYVFVFFFLFMNVTVVDDCISV